MTDLRGDGGPLSCAGAAMAVGVCCGGTGMKEALDLLEPMLKDAVDFVRQGGLIAIALVLMQQPETKVLWLRSISVDQWMRHAGAL